MRQLSKFNIENEDLKAKLLLVRLIHLFAREVLVKKLEIEETKTN